MFSVTCLKKTQTQIQNIDNGHLSKSACECFGPFPPLLALQVASWLKGTSNLMVLRVNSKTAFSVFFNLLEFHFLILPIPFYTLVEYCTYSCIDKRKTYSALIPRFEVPVF